MDILKFEKDVYMAVARHLEIERLESIDFIVLPHNTYTTYFVPRGCSKLNLPPMTVIICIPRVQLYSLDRVEFVVDGKHFNTIVVYCENGIGRDVSSWIEGKFSLMSYDDFLKFLHREDGDGKCAQEVATNVEQNKQ